MTFLHTFHPHAILISFGFVQIHWYGMFIVLGMILGIFIASRLAESYQIKKERIIDLAFYLIIFGIIGARFYDVFLELPYYLKHPLDIFKVWNGGLAIHGAIIAGLLTIGVFAYKLGIRGILFDQLTENNLFLKTRYKFKFAKHKIIEKFWLLCALVVPGLALGQALGRWGNYFNQELFGLPTNSNWGIPIDFSYRPFQYISQEYFLPTFFFESLGNLLVFIVLMLMHARIIKKKKFQVSSYKLVVISYLIMYSILRFSLEFIRIDYAPTIWGWRWPQVASAVIVIFCLALLVLPKFKRDDSL